MATAGSPKFFPLIVDQDAQPTTDTPLTRLNLDPQSGGPWVRPDNFVEIFPDWTQPESSAALYRSINVRQAGGNWAGHGENMYGWPAPLDQTSDANSTCQFYSSGSGAGPKGRGPRRDVWSYDAGLTGLACSNGGRVYCFQE